MTRSCRQSGFTLLEVLVAVAVLAIGFVGVLQVVAQCESRSRDNRDRAEALRLAESKLNELSVQTDLQPGSDEGDFGAENSRFSWKQRIENTETDGLLKLTMTVNWRSGSREQGVDLSACVAPGVLNTGSSATSEAASTTSDAESAASGAAAGATPGMGLPGGGAGGAGGRTGSPSSSSSLR
ncbi:MAG: type II secretion system minor pseudopilin GspI [Armatimonadetes bacterium]|nr:type II secretion system minor pseudopilin GspI [Armatimonadota bacterium]